MMKILIDLIKLFLAFVALGILYWVKRANYIVIPSKVKRQCNIKKYKYKKRKVYVVKNRKVQSSDLYIMYLHGGSYIASFGKEHWHTFNSLSKDLNATIIAPDYPLAPKSTYIDVFNMVEPLYYDILNKVPKKKLVILGDSAGGGIALALMQKVSSKDKNSLPSKIILISPWLDVLMNNSKIDYVAKKDKILNKSLLKVAGEMYIGKGNQDNPLTSPIKGSFSNIDDVVIFTGTYDILNPDVNELKEKTKDKNVNILIKQTEGAEHIWILKKYKDVYKSKEDYNELINIIKS